MAPQAGLEPATLRFTAGCSAIELLRNTAGRIVLRRKVYSIDPLSNRSIAQRSATMSTTAVIAVVPTSVHPTTRSRAAGGGVAAKATADTELGSAPQATR